MSRFPQSRLVLGAGPRWTDATSAAFLDAIADGTLPREAFDRWLLQDRLFVRGLTSFAAILAARAPRDAQRVVLGGLAVLNDELDWFDRHGQERGLELDVPPHPVCHRYVDYLLAAAYTKPVGTLLAVFFGVEASYCHAWGRLARGGPYDEFLERWTTPAFVDYVDLLMELADRHVEEGQQEEFDRVLALERDFWRMTVEG